MQTTEDFYIGIDTKRAGLQHQKIISRIVADRPPAVISLGKRKKAA
jgi:hypothetical protein